MAIPCRSCGRSYDATLFEFGRTIWCTCGSRVGIEPRVRSLAPSVAKRFVADAMLGRLARWLRLLGFDCAYESEIADDELVRRALEEKRIILSRDRRLPEEWWIESVYLVRQERLRAQLVEVLRHFDLASSIRTLSRCSECNRLLEPVARSRVEGRVPARILRTRDEFSHCEACGRVYWEGSHSARIRRVADELVAEVRGPGYQGAST